MPQEKSKCVQECHGEINLTKVAYFPKIYYFTTFQNSTLSDATATITSEVRMTAMMVLLVGGNKKIRR
jgi:hypothetical protein